MRRIRTFLQNKLAIEEIKNILIKSVDIGTNTKNRKYETKA